MTATRRLYWNADRTKLVPEGPEAAFLAYRVGDKVPEAIAVKYGLAEDPKPVNNPEPLENLRTQEPPTLTRRGGRRSKNA